MGRVIVFSDRDGTITKDENYYLGSNPDWKQQVSFLEGVVEGIRLINSIPSSRFYILTNQSGVALRGGAFDNLTLDRAEEVNQYILDALERAGAHVDDWRMCPYIDRAYAEKKRQQGFHIDF